MRLARYIEIAFIKFIYYVFRINKLINIYIILDIISINILLFYFILKLFAIVSRV